MGILMDFLGGAGEGIAENAKMQMKDEMETKRQQEILKLQEEMQRRGQENAERIKVKLQEDLANASAAKQLDAEEKSGAIGEARRFAEFKKKVGQTGATDEELKPAFDQYYNNKVVPTSKGGILSFDQQFIDRPSAHEGDVLTALKQNGAGASTIKSQQDEYKFTLGNEARADSESAKERRADAKDALTAAKLEETERANRAREELRDKQIAAAISGKSGKEGAKEVLSYLGEERKSIKDDLLELNKTYKDMSSNAALSDEEKKKLKDDYDEARRPLTVRQQKLDKDFNAVREKVGLGSNDSTPKTGGITKAEYDKLKSGSVYTAPDGSTRIKP